MKLDEKALEAAAQSLYETWRENEGYCAWVPGGNSFKQVDARRSALHCVTAYLNASPSPVGEVEDIIRRLRLQDQLGLLGVPDDHKMVSFGNAADALTGQAARLAECERELQARKNYTDADYVRLHKAHCMTADELSAATARAEAAEKKLAECEAKLKTFAENTAESVLKQFDIARAATARAEALEKALAFYVDDDNWKHDGPLDPNSGNFTGGPARAALAKGGE